jgi:hypothetical protein
VNYLNTLHGERLRAKYAEAEVERLKEEIETLREENRVLLDVKKGEPYTRAWLMLMESREAARAEADLQSKRAAGFQLAYHSNIRCYCPSEDVCKLSQERLELVEQLAQAQRASCNVVATVEIAEPVKTEDGLSMSEVIEREAFRRGAETMREVAANRVTADPHMYNTAYFAFIIRKLPIPEEDP